MQNVWPTSNSFRFFYITLYFKYCNSFTINDNRNINTVFSRLNLLFNTDRNKFFLYLAFSKLQHRCVESPLESWGRRLPHSTLYTAVYALTFYMHSLYMHMSVLLIANLSYYRTYKASLLAMIRSVHAILSSLGIRFQHQWNVH